MEIVLVWFVFAIIVGVAANTRGRSGGAWFLLAVIISPLLAGLLVLALPNLQSDYSPVTAGEPKVTREKQTAATEAVASSTPDIFEPEGVYAGIPYKALEGGSVLAMYPSGLVRFKNVDQFIAATSQATVPPKPGSARR